MTMDLLKILFVLFPSLIPYAYCITTGNELNVKYKILSFKRCLQSDHVLAMIIQVSLSECVDECAFRTNCQAVNYFTGYHLCELLPDDEGEILESSRKSRACIFVRKADMDTSEVDKSCACGEGESCDLDPQPSCSTKECEGFTIQNGQIKGNMRSTRSAIEYECDETYISTFEEPGATCLTNGTWSYSPDCSKGAAGNNVCSGCVIPRDCQDIKSVIETAETGVYEIQPTGSGAFKVRCDMDTPPGGWTVFQRRESDSDFFRNWEGYKEGFGDLGSNFWLGNDKIWKLTRSDQYKLRVDLTDQNGAEGYAEYNSFSIGNESTKYILNIGEHSGTADDSLVERHNEMKFSTIDQRHDLSNYHDCAEFYEGGWWYNDCQSSNLNGLYGDVECNRGLTWKPWKDQCVFMRRTEMKIRRK